MEIKKMLSSKSMKLVTLLLTSMLIASASAAVYYSLVMQSTVTTKAPDVKFVAGNDSIAAGATGGDLTDSWVRLDSLKAYPNATLTYDQAVNISNTAAGIRPVRLAHSLITNNSAQVSNFASITFKLFAKNGTQFGGDFTYDNTDGDDLWGAAPSMSYINIPGGEVWSVQVVTLAKAGATADQVIAIVINLDVLES